MFSQTTKLSEQKSDYKSKSHGSNSDYGRTEQFNKNSSEHLLYRKAACPCGGGCSTCQSSSNDLKISQPNDTAEIEADQIADKVMRMPADIPMKVNTNISVTDKLHAKCDTYEEEKKTETIFRKEGFDAVSSSASIYENSSVKSVVNSNGRSLDSASRSFFEPRFGRDLGHVRVHNDSTAANSARAINARAYTVGSNIVFGKGEYGPEHERGRHLLAHELAHVMQQEGSSSKLDRSVIYRQPLSDEQQDLNNIDIEIEILSEQLLDPMAAPLMMRINYLQQRKAILLSRTSATIPRTQKSLNEEAVRLGTKQAIRRNLWDDLDKIPSWIIEDWLSTDLIQSVTKELNLYWDSDEKAFIRNRIVDAIEHDVMNNIEAKRIYNATVWDLTVNRKVEKSWFKKSMDVVCDYTNPCHGNMEEFHADIESGMSVEEARKHGLNRIFGWGLEQSLSFGGSSESGSSNGPKLELVPGKFSNPIPATSEITGGNPGMIRESVPKIPIHPEPIWEPTPITKPKAAPEALPEHTTTSSDNTGVVRASKPPPKLNPNSTNSTNENPQPFPVPPTIRIKPPDVDTDLDKKKRRGKCTYESIGQQSGRFPCHADYAKKLSGVPREVRIQSPDGESVDFDAMDHGNTLYEVKTGYRWIAFMSDGPRKTEIITRFWTQAISQIIVAASCGHPLMWYFNDPYAASFFGAENSPYPNYFQIHLPVRVWYVPFNCKEDSDG